MTDRELMQQALDALEKMKAHSYLRLDYAEEAITALRDRLAQPEQEPVTGNLLKDAYNAMVEKKTRSQKLREAGFTRRPKGWEKEKDEQEPVAWMSIGVIVKSEIPQFYTGPLYLTPSQRPWVGLTKEEAKEISLAHRPYVIDMIAALEARLKEKNGG